MTSDESVAAVVTEDLPLPPERATAIKTFETDLSELQAAMPRIHKGEQAIVATDKGSYRYSYADLASIADQVRPLLAKHGFAFVSKPTLNANGRFVLAYALVHRTGARESGEFPLNENLKPQQIGSLITYARRYSLTAVLGLTPDDDDDAAGAQYGSNDATSTPKRPTAGVSGRTPGQDAVAAEAHRLSLPPATAMTQFVQFTGKLWDEANEEDYIRFAEELKQRDLTDADV
jgi:hypothetical protein